MDIGANTSVELDWPSEHFTYQGGDGEQKTVQIAMTPADFLLGDKRTARFYWDLPPRHWHPRMMRLTDYLQVPPESREGTIPYVLGVDQQDTVHRLALSRSILEAVEQCRNRWRHLQELGGINNSHAKRLLERESGRLEEEKQQAIAAIEATYRTELDRNLDDLTHEIVGRIASQLLDETPGNIGTIHRAPSRPSAPKSGPTETRPEEPTVDQQAEEEPLSFDDPYIETPRCTTCNECTRLNGQMFMYNENKQAFINDPTAGSYRQLVEAAEKCPVRIIHPGKPRDSAEPGLEELIRRAAPFN
jgi:ferredoxin